MASKQDLRLGQRYLKNIADSIEQREKGKMDERKARQNEVDRLAYGALPVNEEIQSHSPAAQTPQHLQRFNSSCGRTISELDSGRMTPEASRPATLPTPSISPVTSGTSAKTASAAPLASTMGSQQVIHLHASIGDHQRQIHSLTIELDATKSEVRQLRDERREAFKEHLSAVRRNAEKEIECYKRREERLARMVEEKEQTIEGLERRIDERKERERELKARLVDAERRAEEGEKRVKEAETGGISDGCAGVQGKGMVEKRGSVKAGRTGWEFRRRKGERETPLGAMYQVLVKRRTP